MTTCVAITRRIGPVPIDVILEEVHNSQLEITRNPIEFGADVTDHAYVQPKRLSMRGAVASTPGSPGVLFGLAGTRAAGAWQQLLLLQALREPFSIVTGLKVYNDMLIESLEATRDPDKSFILDFRAELTEVIIVSSASAPASSTQGKSASAGTPGGPTEGGLADGRSGIGTGVARGQVSGTPAPTTGGTATPGGLVGGGGAATTVDASRNSLLYDTFMGN